MAQPSSVDQPRVVARETCRVCGDRGGALVPLLDLGALHLSTFPAAAEELDSRPRVPLTLMGCPTCALVQLRHTTPFDWLFGKEYWYRSGVNEAMVGELRHLVTEASQRVGGLSAADLVLDIGANDGTLLAGYGRVPTRLAFEPSTGMQASLRHHADELYATPFPTPFPKVAQELQRRRGAVKVITAVAMIYDLEDPIQFFAAAGELLSRDGVMVVQFQDLLGMLERVAFDCVCHEHLEYYTVWSLLQAIGAAGLQMVDCQPRAINGGSLRITLRHVQPIRPEDIGGIDRVVAQIGRETDAGLTTLEGLKAAHNQFAWQIGTVRGQVRGMVQQLVDQGGVVDLYGASTKGNTLLQILDLDRGLIRQAIERSPEKWGRFVGRTGIPIVNEAAGRLTAATAWLVPIWQFKREVIQRERAYVAGGGRLIFPLPWAEVVESQGEAVA